MVSRTVRNFGKIGDAIKVPNMVEVQRQSYAAFLQAESAPDKRKGKGLEVLFREIFPIESYDKKMKLEYLGYKLEKLRYNLNECRQLRLTYADPLKVRCRLTRKFESGEEDIINPLGSSAFLGSSMERDKVLLLSDKDFLYVIQIRPFMSSSCHH